MKGLITMTKKESIKIHVVQKAIEKIITQKEASEQIKCSQRNLRRLIKRYKKEGVEGLLHKSRGTEANNKVPYEQIERIKALYRSKYTGFGPTLFTEKLQENEEIKLSKETIRQILIKNEYWVNKPKKKKHRQQRERKPCFGMLLQVDGSHDHWFGEEYPKCVFMGNIDDATSKAGGKFYEYEGTLPALDMLINYIKENGIPMAIYTDLHSTYKVNNKNMTIEEELNNEYPMSQFAKAAQLLGIQIIWAYSAQAKGRVERMFGTLQDRLKKELRLQQITTIKEANQFLPTFFKAYNKKFSKPHLSKGDMHKPAHPVSILRKILCIKRKRHLNNDYTVRDQNYIYQILQSTLSKKVFIEIHTNGQKIIKDSKGKILKYKTIKTPKNIRKEANGKWDIPKIEAKTLKEIHI